MTVRDIKELVADYPDDMPVRFLTFKGTEGWEPATEIDVEDVSLSQSTSISNGTTFQILDILVN